MNIVSVWTLLLIFVTIFIPTRSSAEEEYYVVKDAKSGKTLLNASMAHRLEGRNVWVFNGDECEGYDDAIRLRVFKYSQVRVFYYGDIEIVVHKDTGLVVPVGSTIYYFQGKINDSSDVMTSCKLVNGVYKCECNSYVDRVYRKRDFPVSQYTVKTEKVTR